jgi:MSHA biogenesis protein MshJ
VSALWSRLEARLEGLSLRERGLVLLAALATVFALWDRALLTPLYRAGAERDAERQSLLERIAKLDLESDRLRLRLGASAHDPERARLLQLEQAVRALGAEIEARSAGLVTPQQMTVALRELLERTPGVEILEVRALDPEPLGAPAGSAPQAFRHGMDLRFEADFASSVEFLERVERLPWSFFWSALEYEVTEHPRARVHLRLHTLGSGEGWLGA